MIWAVVLAAGESLRMGSQKLLLPYRDSTIIETIVRTALDSSVDETLVVLGADRPKVGEALRSYPLTLAVNKDFRKGMLSSIQTGFAALPGGTEAAVVMLGDQPDVTPEVIDGLILAFREERGGIVVPVHGGRRGHPILIAGNYRNEVLGLDPGIGLRQLLRAHPGDVFEVEVEDGAILRDMDKPSDYRGAAGRVRPGRVRVRPQLRTRNRGQKGKLSPGR